MSLKEIEKEFSDKSHSPEVADSEIVELFPKEVNLERGSRN